MTGGQERVGARPSCDWRALSDWRVGARPSHDWRAGVGGRRAGAWRSCDWRAWLQGMARRQ